MTPLAILLVLVGLGLPALATEPAPAPTVSGKIVIAHRGASGHLPEHTLESKVLAHAMGADFVEQDVVLSKDGHVVVLHDLHLDAITDVAHRFPGRAREDGKHYAADFLLDHDPSGGNWIRMNKPVSSGGGGRGGREGRRRRRG